MKLIFWENINLGWGVFENVDTRGAASAYDVALLPDS